MEEDGLELRAAPGFVQADVREEFPGLRLDWITVRGGRRASSPELVQRLRALSNRYRGSGVVAMRTQPIPHAYRAFFRHIGLDPDVTRIPSEQVAVARLLHGRLRSRDRVSDALLIALVETGVPVWALDAEFVGPGGLGIRTTVEGDRLGSGQRSESLVPGALAVADEGRVHAMLFGEVATEHAVSSRTNNIALYAVGVPGVPAIHVEEALWTCAQALGDPRAGP
ncbi:MAG: hypothetical protein JO206_01305 [Solirubrobacterales bacterium]|nr:hypothetical protein [Solirubrobacterales bacterium]MBV9837308.1 hypothetical protein [Solirubrobacterales bacterium]